MDEKSKVKIEEIIEKIKNVLGANYRENTEELIEDTYNEMYSIALNTSHLKSSNKEELLYPYIKEAVVSKYIRMGAEGMSNRNEGSESSSFIDIEEKMRNDIIRAGLRRLP
ncbi:MAG: hypothetical protein Q4D02_01830 [Clostridia bacterium]|nr:hypothetical protein [Clostridia bacterium]